MEVSTHSKNINNQLNILENQIDKIISDIGRLSSYRLSSSEILSSIRIEKLNYLHLLKEKKARIIRHTE
jgi:flagellar biosynthesis chaperone FliJ